MKLLRITISVFLFAAVAFPRMGVDPVRSVEAQAVHASNLGQFDKACELYAHELDLLFAKGRQMDAAAVYTEIGEITQIHGEFPAAEASYQKAVEIFKQYAKPADLRYVTALDDLGWLYITWGRRVEGARLLDQARDRGETAPPNDPKLMRHLDTQAAYLAVMGRFSDAEKEWDRALAIGAATFGADSPDYDNLLVHYGQAADLAGQYATAADMFRRYLDIEGRVPQSATATSRAVAAGELAHVYTELHQFDDAQRWFDESFGIFKSEADEAPLVYSMIIAYHGDYYMARQQWRDAENQYRKALDIQQRVLGNTHAVAASMVSLARALRKVHEKGEAKQLETQAKSILAGERNIPGQQTVDVLALRHEEQEHD